MRHLMALIKGEVNTPVYHKNHAALALSAALLLLSIYIWLLRTQRGGNFPLFGEQIGNVESRRKAFIKNGVQLYRMGYQTFRGKIFRLTTWDGERFVLPLELLDELRHLSDDVLDNVEMIEKAFEIKYTGRIGNSAFMAHTIRADLTRNLNSLTKRLATEVQIATSTKLGTCQNWTSVRVYEKMLEVVAIVSGLAFLGPEINHEPQYMHSAIRYTVDLFAAASQLKRWHPYVRPFGALFCKRLNILRQHRKEAITFLMPYIEERRRVYEAGGELDDCMLNWMLKKADHWKISNRRIAEVQLSLSLAAIHTTTRAVTNVFYDLAVMPELRNELLGEIKSVLKQNKDGLDSTASLFQLKLLDSVMKESQRTNTNSEVRFNRLVKKPITLKDGTQLSSGAVIEAPFGAIVNDEEFYPDPRSYDPYRFLRLREGTTPDPIRHANRENYQYVAVSKEFMGFGYGRHACPGRFFAANEIKLIVARILLDYDFQMPNGKIGMGNRYKSVVNAASSLPNSTNAILFKKRRVDQY